MIKELLGYLFLLFGVTGVVTGIGGVAHDMPIGWLGIVGGVASAVISYRLMQTADGVPDKNGSEETPPSKDEGANVSGRKP